MIVHKSHLRDESSVCDLCERYPNAQQIFTPNCETNVSHAVSKTIPKFATNPFAQRLTAQQDSDSRIAPTAHSAKRNSGRATSVKIGKVFLLSNLIPFSVGGIYFTKK
jgi:hypothetical protein